ncbi:unnamed protein product, partial [Nesidiocoris tenuis]
MEGDVDQAMKQHISSNALALLVTMGSSANMLKTCVAPTPANVESALISTMATGVFVSLACSANPCRNGGTCWSSVDSFYCACRPGYTGKICN